MAHHPIKLHISHNQVAKIRRGEPIQLKHEHIGHPHGHVFHHLHPMNLEKIHKAHRKGAGIRVQLTEPELHGTGLLDSIKKGIKWIGQHSGVLKPLASAALDAGAHFFPGAQGARSMVRDLTGVGIHHKRAHHAHHMRGGDMHIPGPQFSSGPMYFPGGAVEEQIQHTHPHFVLHKKPKRKVAKRKVAKGRGIIPAGFSY